MQIRSVSNEKIEDVPPIRCGGLIELCITASGTRDGKKLFVLNIKYFCKVPASSLELIRLIAQVPAFWAHILPLFHDDPSFLYVFVLVYRCVYRYFNFKHLLVIRF